MLPSLEGAFPGVTFERHKQGAVVLWAMLGTTGQFPAQDADFIPRELQLSTGAGTGSLDDAQGGYFEGRSGYIWADRILAQVHGFNVDVWVF
jgi:hypothetical protein